MGLEKPPEGMQVAMRRVLERFGKNPVEARKGLSQFLTEGLRTGDWEEFYQPRANRYLGDEPFIETIKHQRKEPIRRIERRLVKLVDVEELGAQTQTCFKISQSELCSTSQQRSMGRIRKAFVHVGRYKYRFATKALAEYLQRQESAVSMMLRRMWKAEEAGTVIATLLDHLSLKVVAEPKAMSNCEV